MAENLLPVWDPLEYSFQDFPTSLGEPDENALSDEQKKVLKKFLMKKRHDDLEYLNSTPMIRAVIRDIFQQVLTAKPIDFKIFLKNYFSQPKEYLQKQVEQHLKSFTTDKTTFMKSTQSQGKPPSSSIPSHEEASSSSSLSQSTDSSIKSSSSKKSTGTKPKQKSPKTNGNITSSGDIEITRKSQEDQIEDNEETVDKSNKIFSKISAKSSNSFDEGKSIKDEEIKGPGYMVSRKSISTKPKQKLSDTTRKSLKDKSGEGDIISSNTKSLSQTSKNQEEEEITDEEINVTKYEILIEEIEESLSGSSHKEDILLQNEMKLLKEKLQLRKSNFHTEGGLSEEELDEMDRNTIHYYYSDEEEIVENFDQVLSNDSFNEDDDDDDNNDDNAMIETSNYENDDLVEYKEADERDQLEKEIPIRNAISKVLEDSTKAVAKEIPEILNRKYIETISLESIIDDEQKRHRFNEILEDAIDEMEEILDVMSDSDNEDFFGEMFS